jgi:4-diphosphocytidyl-2C-methyl-D-erythritol kinase
MTSVIIDAPAKVNIFLKILNKRKDGYHDIVTLFERISLSDRIRISKIPKGIRLFSDLFITRWPQDNLAYKAAELMIRSCGLKYGIRIDIKKVIPIAAGLGGGSSDAAGVLLGMNRLFGLRMSKKELMALGARLGSDVPFFILEKPFAIGRSRGERLETVPFNTRLWHLIINPGFGVSTKEAYEAFDTSSPPNRGLKAADTSACSVSTLSISRTLDRGSRRVDRLSKHLIPRLRSGSSGELLSKHLIPRLRSGSSGELLSKHLIPRLRSGSSGELLSNHLTIHSRDVKINDRTLVSLDYFGGFESMLYNDLEDTVIAEKETIGVILERLASYLGKKAVLSGSGPSVFCLYRTRKEAEEAKKVFLKGLPAVKRKKWQVFVAGTVG